MPKCEVSDHETEDRLKRFCDNKAVCFPLCDAGGAASGVPAGSGP